MSTIHHIHMIKEIVKSFPVRDFSYSKANGQMLSSSYRTDAIEINYMFHCSGSIHGIYYPNAEDDIKDNGSFHEFTIFFPVDSVDKKPKKIILNLDICGEYRLIDFDVNVYNIDLLTCSEFYTLLDFMKNGLRYKTPEMVNILVELECVIEKRGGRICYK